jgi:hypothetical protein
MKTRMVLLVAALLVFACSGFGQGFSYLFYNDSYPLRDICEVGTPYGDGAATILIYWDADSDGPDADDQLATMCNNPPLCPDGPAGSVNYNQFPINGEAQLGEPGLFITEVNFTSSLVVPQPARYWFGIRCSDGLLHYATGIHVLSSGPHEEAVTDWQCVAPTCGGQPCVPNPPIVQFSRFPVPAYQCAEVCAVTPTLVVVCPLDGPLDPAKTPIVVVHPGCVVPDRCTVECPPATATLGPWFYNTATGCFEAVLTADNDGCVCITLEGFLAVGFNNDFVAQASDGQVQLTWSTNAEVAMARYDIYRNGTEIGRVVAANTAHQYNFVDETAVNGTSYTYSLRAVDENLSVTELATVDATPSFGAAVVTEYALHQNFPNPFNPSTSLTFDVVEKNHVTLKVFNAAGQEVGTVANGEFDSGRHIVSFDAGNLPTGLYFYTVKIGNEFTATKKMLLVK